MVPSVARRRVLSLKLLKCILYIAQIAFFVVIGFLTWRSYELLQQQNNLLHKPIVGVSDIDYLRHFEDLQNKGFENLKYVSVVFRIENVGSLPAKQLRMKTVGKFGNTTLPFREDNTNESGAVIVPGMSFSNTARISKKLLTSLLNKSSERLVYTVAISYRDWDDINEYKYNQEFEVEAIQREPLRLTFSLRSGNISINGIKTAGVR